MTIDPEGGPFVRLSFTFRVSGLDDAPRIEHTIRLPLHAAWEIVEAIQTMGPTRALVFASFAVMVANTGHQEVPYPQGDELLKLQAAINYLASMFGHRWETLEDRVLAFTYQFLKHTDMNRKMAAKFASSKLPKHYTEEAWRKQVDRWAADPRRKLPPVGRPRRKKTRLESVE